MLEWWGTSPGAGQVEDVSAAGLADVPLDLRLRLDRAVSLGLATPGVDEVLSRHRRPSGPLDPAIAGPVDTQPGGGSAEG
jgi:hypothetical protein